MFYGIYTGCPAYQRPPPHTAVLCRHALLDAMYMLHLSCLHADFFVHLNHLGGITTPISMCQVTRQQTNALGDDKQYHTYYCSQITLEVSARILTLTRLWRGVERLLISCKFKCHHELQQTSVHLYAYHRTF